MDTPNKSKPDRPHSPSPSLDSVTTIRDDGSRRFLFPADAPGRYSSARFFSGLLLIAIYILMPWIKINGYPALFLDVANRRFHLFGWTLAAQDMWLLFFLITGLGFTLFFVTALLGRLWCGWACPHTVFLDHVYRRIERLIDGNAHDRRLLDEAPWDGAKLVKRFSKHLLYLLVSTAIAHFFLAYFVSIPALWQMISASPLENWSSFGFVMISTGILYFNFAWFREQLCIVICPYGRLQSSLIDDNTMVIGYDVKRGEPRGKLGTPGAGDCVACNRCVQVCPTGIDIRQGLQLECVGCSACIDACDDVMDKISKPRGLVRYASMAQLAGQKTKWLRPRTIIYGILFAVGVTVTLVTFSKVRPASFAVTRMVGTPYVVDANSVRNQFMVRLVNKQTEPAQFFITVEGGEAMEQTGLSEPVTIPAMAEEVRPLVLSINRKVYQGSFRFTLIMHDGAKTFELKREVKFLGPEAELLREEDLEKGTKR